MRRTIPYRETLTADIFEEMTENYPLIAVDGREYKQELKYYSFPSDFKFVKFRFDCKSNDVDTGDALCVLSYLITLTDV